MASTFLWVVTLGLRPGGNRRYLDSSPDLVSGRNIGHLNSYPNRGYLDSSLGLRLGRNRGYLDSSPDLVSSRNKGYLNSNPDLVSSRNIGYLNSSSDFFQVETEDI